MKICKQCGAEIINGVNGCVMAGDVCFSCRPWNIKPICSTRSAWDYAGGDYEDAILARQEAYMD